MPTTKSFINYFNHLVEYQNQLLPDDKLSKDYAILYDYVMDLLEKDEIFAKLLVRRKQQTSNINADILLDLTKLFNIHPFIREPMLCLCLSDRCNERFKNVPHPLCNQKQSIIPRKIKKHIWLALHNGLLKCGSFVRGYHGDIYELSLSSSDRSEIDVRLHACSDDITININLRILLKFTNQHNFKSPLLKPYPEHKLKKDWLASVPKQFASMFEICLPRLEEHVKQHCFKLVMILRVLKFLFKKNKQLDCLNVGFLESIIYTEYMEKIRGEEKQMPRYDYIITGVLTRMYNALKNKNLPSFWNTRLNLIKYFECNSLFLKTCHELNNIFGRFNNLKSNASAEYDEFFEYFDFKMDPFTYEVDQFGIFKSY